MAAAAGPPFPLGLAVPGAAAAAAAALPGAAAAAAAALPGAPAAVAVPFTDAIMGGIAMGVDASGYQLDYDVYTASLEPSLRFYDQPAVAAVVRGAPPPPAPAAAPGGDPADPEIRRIDAYIRAHRPVGWTNNIIRSIVGTARAAMAIPYNPANPAPYRVAFNAFLDIRANQLAAGLPGANVIPHVNIGP